MANNLIDTVTPTVANVILPPWCVTQLLSEMADLKKLILVLHAVQHQSCPSSCTLCRDKEKHRPYLVLTFAFTFREHLLLLLYPMQYFMLIHSCFLFVLFHFVLLKA